MLSQKTRPLGPGYIPPNSIKNALASYPMPAKKIFFHMPFANQPMLHKDLLCLKDTIFKRRLLSKKKKFIANVFSFSDCITMSAQS